MTTFLTIVLLIGIVAHFLLVLLEVFGAHSNSHVAAAAHFMRSGGLSSIFWGVFLTLGSLVPLVLLCIALLVPVAQPALLGSAGLCALAGLFAYEHCFVVAGQVVPLS